MAVKVFAEMLAPNHITIQTETGVYFQSYSTMIARRFAGRVFLDPKWNCSKTTSKYRAVFLGETTKETERKIKSGEYEVVDLN